MAITPKHTEVVIPFDTLRVQRILDRITLSFDMHSTECLHIAETLENGEVWVLSNVKGQVFGKLVP